MPSSGENSGSARGLSACNGECDSDRQCEAGTICFQREDWEPIPGCIGTSSGRDQRWDYCAIAGTPNLLRGRTPSVSSTHSGSYRAQEMTDGNQGSTGNFWHSRMRSSSDTNWAEVRFSRPTVVTIVRFWNRVDCCYDRINGAQIYGRDQAGTLHRIGRPLRQTGAGGGGSVGNRGAISRSWYGDQPFVSIRIQQRNGQNMQISELEAYGRAPTTSAPATSAPVTSAPVTSAPTTNIPTSAPSRNPTTSAPSGAPTTSSPTARPTVNPTTSLPTFTPTISPPTRSPTSAPTTDADRLAMCSGNGLLKRSWSDIQRHGQWQELREACECYDYAAGAVHKLRHRF